MSDVESARERERYQAREHRSTVLETVTAAIREHIVRSVGLKIAA